MSFRERPEYKEWQRKVKERDGYAYRRCRFESNLHVHHIKPVHTYPEFAFDIDNGITLCGNCHTLITGQESEIDIEEFIKEPLSDSSKTSGNESNEILALVDEGFKEAEEENEDVAIELLEKAVELGCQRCDVYTALSRCYFHKAYKNAISGWFIVDKESPKKSLKYADLALETDSTNIDARLRAIYAYSSFWEDKSKAIKLAVETLKMVPSNVEVRMVLGNIYRKVELHKEAIKEIKAALKIDPHYVWGHQLLALCYKETGQYKDAIDEARYALLLDPESSEGMKRLIEQVKEKL